MIRMTKLRYKLINCNVPQYRISGITGVHPSRISEYSLNQKKIPPHHLIALAQFFECEPEDLIGMVDAHDPTEFKNQYLVEEERPARPPYAPRIDHGR